MKLEKTKAVKDNDKGGQNGGHNDGQKDKDKEKIKDIYIIFSLSFFLQSLYTARTNTVKDKDKVERYHLNKAFTVQSPCILVLI